LNHLHQLRVRVLLWPVSRQGGAVKVGRAHPLKLHHPVAWQSLCLFQISVTHKNQVPMLMAHSSSRKSSLFGFLRRS